MYKAILEEQMFNFLLEDESGMFIYNFGPSTRYLSEVELKNLIRVAQNTLQFYQKNDITDEIINQKNNERSELVLNELRQREKNQKPKKRGYKYKKGYIYLAQNTKTKSYKIGFSKNVKSRINTLNISSEYKIILVDKFKGVAKDEFDLHLKLKDYRKNSEWFEDNEAVINEFNSYKK